MSFKVEKRKKFDLSKCTNGEKLEKYQKRKCMKLLGVSKDDPAAFGK